MSYLEFVVLIVPALIGLIAALVLGRNRGVFVGGIVMLVAVFILLLFQVSPPAAELAWGLMRFEWYRWAPSFLVGAAIGLVIIRIRSA